MQPLVLKGHTADGFLHVVIRVDDIDLAGDLVQELAEELRVGPQGSIFLGFIKLVILTQVRYVFLG